MAFVYVRENPVPPGSRPEWLKTPDGLKLRYALWNRGEHPLGTVILLHGRTEFIEKYFETIGELIARGYSVATLDWRGQGMSSRLLKNPLKGHVEAFDDYVRDLRLFFDKIVRQRCPPPHHILAHSMGGAITLAFLHDHGEVKIARAVLSAPMTGIRLDTLSRERALLLARAARFLGFSRAFIPGGAKFRPINEPFERNVVTQDRERFQRTKALIRAAPELALGSPTLGWLETALKTTLRFEDPAYCAAIKPPVLILSAGQDALVRNDTHAAVAKALPQGAHVTIEGARHELLQETKSLRTRFWRAFDAFFEEVPRAAAPGPIGPPAPPPDPVLPFQRDAARPRPRLGIGGEGGTEGGDGD